MSEETIAVVPTCVPRDEADLAECAQAVRTFSKTIHLDIDDGIFTSVRTWPYKEAGVFGAVGLTPLAALSVEVHLMVEEPRRIGAAFAKAGARTIIGHVEAFSETPEAHGALDLWRRSGAQQVGLALLLDTPVEVEAWDPC